MAVRDALEKANMFLLEPIMDVEVFVSDKSMGDAIADLNTRGRQDRILYPQGGSADHQGNGSPGTDVWLLNSPSVGHPGTGNLYHAVFKV